MIVVAFAAAAQYVQGRQALRTPVGVAPKGDAQAIGRAMTFAAPVLTFVIFLGLPAAVALYWLVSSLFSIFQQYHLIRHLDHGSHRTFHQNPDSASGLS